MHIIASSKDYKQGLSKNQKAGYAIVGGLLVIACMLIYFFTETSIAFALLILYGGIFGVRIWRARRSSGLFIAYVDGLLLRIDYEVEENNGSLDLKKFAVPLDTIQGYTKHSFLKMHPALIEIQFGDQSGGGRSRPITIESLSDDGQQKLFHFLDSIISKTRRLN